MRCFIMQYRLIFFPDLCCIRQTTLGPDESMTGKITAELDS